MREVEEAILERPYWFNLGVMERLRYSVKPTRGVIYFVVVVDEGEAAFVVTAREMDDAQHRTFQRKAR